MPIREEKECTGWKQNTQLTVDIYSHLSDGDIVAKVLVHVTHGPLFWNDSGRTIRFSLNDRYSDAITDKDGRCQLTISKIPEDKPAVLLIHAYETSLTTPCEMAVQLLGKKDAYGNTALSYHRVPTADEAGKMATWEKALIGTGVVIALGTFGYLAIKATH